MAKQHTPVKEATATASCFENWMPSLAYTPLVKQFFLFFLFPWWDLVWVYQTTAFLNFIGGHTRRSPVGTLLKYILIPFYAIGWTAESNKRIKGMSDKLGKKYGFSILCLLYEIFCSLIRLVVYLAVAALILVAIGLVVYLIGYLILSYVWEDIPPGLFSGEANLDQLFQHIATFVKTVADLQIWQVLLGGAAVLGGLSVVLLVIFVCTKLHYMAMQSGLNLLVKNSKKQVSLDDSTMPLLEIRHLDKAFPLQKTIFGKVKKKLVAVDDVSFAVYPGETLGIVGESGCGKTTLGRTILHLHEKTGGQVIYKGLDISELSSFEMRCLRTDMQIIFQDPYSSLPPRSTVGDILSEPVKVHHVVPAGETKSYILNLMEQCGLRDYYYERYPHEFSGGQRQRICIARALSVDPQLVVCDEPVSALDVSIQAQIINLLKKLQKERNLTYLFISHDLSVVKFISDKIGVMYLGSMVEFGRKEDIFANPMHPYTRALLSAIPNPDPDKKMERIVLKGDIPSPANPPKGCRFHTRCPNACEKCSQCAPTYREYEPGHFVACHLLEQDESEAAVETMTSVKE